jgi:hypothetical protein
MDTLIIGFCLAIIVLGALVLIFLRPARKSLSSQRIRYFQSEIRGCKKLSPTERIMRYDAILHFILEDYGYSGTVGDQLKAKPTMIGDLDRMWDLHKLRNHLAHEMKPIAHHVLESRSKLFEKELLRLLKR